jgi:CheY-like chemotaxis protein/two-component sensor histidine kinase
MSDLPFADLRDGLVRDFGHVADQKGVRFSVELAPDLPLDISTDPGRLRQVLKNLLSNAFKFTERGEVSVRVSRAESGWSPENETLNRAAAVTALSVTDTGIGIPADTQRRIFEAFAQADGTTARQYGGTGLGLSISRELVRLLGGEIALHSTPEQGSTFTMYLPSSDARAQSVPMPPTDVTVPQLPPRRPAGAALAGTKALVVDDDFRNIFALTSLLERGQVEVISAESGAEGIALLERTPDVDIVLLDIMMPVMDGYATMRAMRQLPQRATLPIIAITANVTAGERQRCIDAGASDYVSKPVETDELLLVLGEWLPLAAPAGEPTAALGR